MNTVSFGHFTECVRFRHETPAPDASLIRGQHCFVAFKATEISTIPDDRTDFDWREM